MAWSFRSIKGQSLVEILVAIGLATLLIPALLTGLVASREGRAQQLQRLQASAYLVEAQEAVRSVRETGWTNVSVSGTFYPARSGSVWSLVSTTSGELISGYTRKITISDATRDPVSGAISATGSADPATRKIVITVSWPTPYYSYVSSTTFLTRYVADTVWFQTYYNDFNAGTKTSVAVEFTNGSPTDGDVVLSGGGHGDWCKPDLTLAQVDLPKNGVANAVSAIPATLTSPGIAFAGTGNNASGVAFAKVSVSDTDPPLATVSGTYNSSNSIKTNAVFGDASFAYLATDTHTKEIDILNATSSAITEVGWFDAPGQKNGTAIYVVGNTGYMTSSDNNFYIFNLTANRVGSQGSAVGSVALAGTGTKIRVLGNYAYVAENSASTQLQVINISNPASPTIVAHAASLNDQGATDVFINDSQTRAYVVTSASATHSELFILNISPPSGILPVLASYEAGGMSPTGVVAVTNNKVIIVGTGGIEYQVVNYDGNTTISNCTNGPGTLTISTGINGVAAVVQPSNSAFSYIITGDASSEFKIIQGGPTGQAGLNGIFESSTFSAGAPVSFNNLSASVSTPNGSSITFLADVADPVSGNCADAVFDSYKNVSATGTIPFGISGNYHNPGRCFRYKAVFSTPDLTTSPTLDDVTVNYSP